MKYKDVVIMNGYAGSLTIAATEGGYNVLASLEDCGYGLDAQRANFPDLHYIPELPWPELGHRALHEAVVLAHPPCAAFSAQNNSTNRGLDTNHFDCTRRVVNYAAQHDAAAILVESVTPALEGARSFYDAWAHINEYDCYRILQNAVTFGVPQWRPRYWTVLIKQGLLYQDLLILHHKRRYVTVGEALADVLAGEKVPWLERKWQRQLEYLELGGVRDLLDPILIGEYGYGPLVKVLAKIFEVDRFEAQERFHISNYQSDGFKLLNPDGYASTVMWDSAWLWQGRPLTVPEYNVLAGYPATYKFPKLRMQGSYLSKGVAPPVARWLLDEVMANLRHESEPVDYVGGEHTYLLKPGETADLTIKRGEFLQRQLV